MAFEGDNINPGTVSVTITGKGAYGGTIETGFTILPGDLAYATVDVIADQTETGEPLCPAPTVELEGKILVEDVDYSVSYEDNVEEGTAMLIVAGIGSMQPSKSSKARRKAKNNKATRWPLCRL